MLDDHDAQVLAFMLVSVGAMYVLREEAPSLTVVFAGLVAVCAGTLAWWIVSHLKGLRRYNRSYFNRKHGRPSSGYLKWRMKRNSGPFRPLAVLIMAGLCLFAVSAIYGTGIAAVDEPVSEMVQGQDTRTLSDWEAEDIQRERVERSDDREYIRSPARVYVSENQVDEPPIDEIVEGSIEYWNGEGSQYAERDLRFVLVSDRENADIVVRYVAEASDHCNYPRAVGCAAMVEDIDGRLIDATVYIEAGYSRSVTVRTSHHEFGHVLGLGHSDEPLEIMRTGWD